MILSRWQRVLTATPHLHPLPFVREEAIRPPGRRRACPTTRFDRVLLAVTPITATSRPRHGERAMIAPYQEDFLFSCFRDSLGVRSRVRYCTVTSVPTGISEKNFRAVSSGNRMQPCDAG
jgi:hypothetical protein